ncbi:MAG: hypothetical protein JWQ68_2367 [Cryobacterium sp.]|jgi:hypothetical protein|nr:hypothetical protein [Cryobacterium sp.]
MRITSLEPDEVFVFGSNASGHHGAGAARTAHERFGAVWGQGHGLQGRSYGIDTMSGLATIRTEVAQFLRFAGEHPELRFLVTEIGCGIAGHTPEEVAPMFRDSPDNVVLPERFRAVLDASPSADATALCPPPV